MTDRVAPDVLVFERDETKVLNNYFDATKEAYFPKLKHININYIFRTVQEKDSEGNLVVGAARKLSNKERDLYGFDFEICVHKETWIDANKKYKQRIAWHELRHLEVKYKYKMNEPMVDRAGRVKTGLLKHDLVIMTFLEEIEIFGPTGQQKDAIFLIEKYLKKKKRKIKRRR